MLPVLIQYSGMRLLVGIIILMTRHFITISVDNNVLYKMPIDCLHPLQFTNTTDPEHPLDFPMATV